MGHKKSPLQKLAARIRKEHNIDVDLINHYISIDKIKTIINKSKDNNKITIIGSKANLHMSDTNEIGLLIYKCIEIDIKTDLKCTNCVTYFIKAVFEHDTDDFCKICTEKYDSMQAIRYCNNCFKSICVICQIKNMISGMENQELKCPYCTHISHFNANMCSLKCLVNSFNDQIISMIDSLFLKEVINQDKKDTILLYVSKKKDEFKYNHFELDSDYESESNSEPEDDDESEDDA